jgi:cob(I)alamin adenosyltransferase
MIDRPRGTACTGSLRAVKIYTRTGDEGTTGLLYGGRVRKDSERPEVNGAIDEAQAALGLARSGCRGTELDEILIGLERDLYVLMAEVATAPDNRHKLSAGASLATQDMVDALEGLIDQTSERFEMPTEFVIPGGDAVSAALDVARTVVRRAERVAVSVADLDPARTGSDPAPLVVPYLNRLSDLLWALARWQEGEVLPSRAGEPTGPI